MKDPADPGFADDLDYQEYLAFMKKYYPDGNPTDQNNAISYASSFTMAYVLKQCGNNLTRDNLMKQAASLHDLVVPMVLDGIKLNTGPTDFAPMKSERMSRFNGKTWELFGDIIGGS